MSVELRCRQRRRHTLMIERIDQNDVSKLIALCKVMHAVGVHDSKSIIIEGQAKLIAQRYDIRIDFYGGDTGGGHVLVAKLRK